MIHPPHIEELTIERADGSRETLTGLVGFTAIVTQVVEPPSPWVPGSQQTYAQTPVETVESHADGQHWRTVWRVSSNPQEHS